MAVFSSLLIGLYEHIVNGENLALPIQIFMTSIVAGYFLDAIGLGMGAIIVPVLIILGVNPVLAIASSLMLQAVTAPLGRISHIRMGNIRKNILVPLVIAGTLGGILVE